MCRKVRSLFLSDLHLGFKGCQSELLLKLLKDYDYDYLFLVGDIIDLWSMKSKLYWPMEHNKVVKYIIKIANKKGVRVIFIPGNHDELLREYSGGNFVGVEIHDEYFHQTADGKTLLLLHGDKFDLVVQNQKWLALLGSRLYDLLLESNHWLNKVRRALGLPYWSLSGYLKYRVKKAVQYIDNYEQAVVKEALVRNVSGIIAGHIHHPDLITLDVPGEESKSVIYGNCGDFVESCSGIVEHRDGTLELIKYKREISK